MYRCRQVWRILFLLLLTTSPWPCLQNSRNPDLTLLTCERFNNASQTSTWIITLASYLPECFGEKSCDMPMLCPISCATTFPVAASVFRHSLSDT